LYSPSLTPAPSSLDSHLSLHSSLYFFFKDTPTTEIYTLSLHDALPILFEGREFFGAEAPSLTMGLVGLGHVGREVARRARAHGRSEEHTSELQSLTNLVCRLLLEKKKNTYSRTRVSARLTYHRYLRAPS